MVQRTLTLIAGIALVLVNRFLIRVGLRQRADGWRRGAGLVLRGEAATFVLSAFALDILSDDRASNVSSLEMAKDHLAARLAKFLAGEAELHRCVRRSTFADRAEACDGPSYTLGFESWVDGPGRFVRPDSWDGEDCTALAGSSEIAQRDSAVRVLLNIVCRIHPEGGADLWVRVNHVGVDGVPVQDMLSRLEAAWGLCGEVVYPTPDAFGPHGVPRKCAGRDDLVELQAFVDFNPLLAWRKHQNAGLPEPMTVSAAILWCLARHEAFSGLYMGTTVELPATKSFGRGVGIVAVRPLDYFDRQNGMSQYARDFNHQLDLTRRRESSSIKTLDAAALIPARLETELLRRTLEQGGSAFGSFALSILRDARIFGAPIADFGQADGFLAPGQHRAADRRWEESWLRYLQRTRREDWRLSRCSPTGNGALPRGCIGIQVSQYGNRIVYPLGVPIMLEYGKHERGNGQSQSSRRLALFCRDARSGHLFV